MCPFFSVDSRRVVIYYLFMYLLKAYSPVNRTGSPHSGVLYCTTSSNDKEQVITSHVDYVFSDRRRVDCISVICGMCMVILHEFIVVVEVLFIL